MRGRRATSAAKGWGSCSSSRWRARSPIGDPIRAVIRGSAVNNDGQGSGLLVAPSPTVQAAMLRRAYQAAGVEPGRVGYVEAHGTGTRVGDPVELAALGEVLGEGRAPGQPCLTGSVKTNIGHTEAASGIAGLIKTVLCLEHRLDPAQPAFLRAESPHRVGHAAAGHRAHPDAVARRVPAGVRGGELLRRHRHQRPCRAGGGAGRARRSTIRPP